MSGHVWAALRVCPHHDARWARFRGTRCVRHRAWPSGTKTTADRGCWCSGQFQQGLLKGIDVTYNAILEDSFERVFSPSAGVEQIKLGLYIIRGDNIAVIGELDVEVDGRLDWSALMADPLASIVH